MNFAKGQSEDFTKSDIMKLYNGVKTRMESRFMRKGEIPGILFLVSSKKSEYDFLEQYTKTQIGNPHTLIIDEPEWNIKPSKYYSGGWFKVAIGNKFIKSTIVKDGEDVESYIKQGYRIIDVPEDHRKKFELDLDSSLMDIANIAIESKSKFIAFDRLSANYSQHRMNPFTMEVLTIGMDDNLEIKDFFKLEQVDDYTRGLPGFIHIDTSLKGDKTGLSYVCISGTKNVDKYKKEENRVFLENENDLVYKQVFTIGIKAPSNSEISFEKTRTFIYFLRANGFSIRGISCDGFQSADTIQQLITAGYNAKRISLDRTDEGYMTFKSAINEGRLDLLNLRGSLLENEIIDLQREGSGKIDHPQTGCLHGDTLIKTKTSIKPIKLLTINDIIFAYDITVGLVIESEFTSLRITKFVDILYKIVTNNNQEILCTDNHPILTTDGYIRADELSIGTELKDFINGISIVTKIDIVYQKNTPVYDIEVPKHHNFILANGLIVHNSKDESDSLCGAIFNASKSKLKENMVHAQSDAELTVDLLDDGRELNIERDVLGLNGVVVNPDNISDYTFDDDILI